MWCIMLTSSLVWWGNCVHLLGMRRLLSLKKLQMLLNCLSKQMLRISKDLGRFENIYIYAIKFLMWKWMINEWYEVIFFVLKFCDLIKNVIFHISYTPRMLQPIWIQDTQNTQILVHVHCFCTIALRTLNVCVNVG